MDSRAYAYVRGRVLPADRARVPLLDRGFLLGDGVFETLRTYHREPFRLEEHLARLRRSAAAIDLAVPLDDARIGAVVARGIARLPGGEVSIRLWVTRGGLSHARPGATIYEAPARAHPEIYGLFRPLAAVAPEVLERGVAVRTIQDDRPISLARVKLMGGVPTMLARRDALVAGAYEVVRIDAGGRVTEGSMSNVFAVVDGVLTTPPLSDGVLDGVTRAVALEAAARMGIATREATIERRDLARASEAMLTHTTAGCVPVVRIDERGVGDGTVGPVGRALVGWFARLASEEGDPAR